MAHHFHPVFMKFATAVLCSFAAYAATIASLDPRRLFPATNAINKVIDTTHFQDYSARTKVASLEAEKLTKHFTEFFEAFLKAPPMGDLIIEVRELKHMVTKNTHNSQEFQQKLLEVYKKLLAEKSKFEAGKIELPEHLQQAITNFSGVVGALSYKEAKALSSVILENDAKMSELVADHPSLQNIYDSIKKGALKLQEATASKDDDEFFNLKDKTSPNEELGSLLNNMDEFEKETKKNGLHNKFKFFFGLAGIIGVGMGIETLFGMNAEEESKAEEQKVEASK